MSRLLLSMLIGYLSISLMIESEGTFKDNAVPLGWPDLSVNMEMQFEQDSSCSGTDVTALLITRVLSAGGPVIQCNDANGFGFMFTGVTYNFDFDITDYGSGGSTTNYTASYTITNSYFSTYNAGNPLSLAGGIIEMYFADTNWVCNSGNADCTNFYNVYNGGSNAYLGECESTSPPRIGHPIGTLPNWKHSLTINIPGTVVGPALIDFSNTSESVNTYLYNAFSPMPVFGPIPQSANAEGYIGNCGGSDCPPQILVASPNNDDCDEGPLFINLNRFEGSHQEDHALLEWEVFADEPSNIVLEHSVDGERFSELDKWNYPDFGFYTILETYQHKTPFKGYNYYRLKMITENGVEEYSPLVSLYFGSVNDEGRVQIYPNPASEYLNIETKEPYFKIEIISIDGRIVLTEEFNAVTNHKVSLDEFTPGSYIIRVLFPNSTQALKFVID